MGLFQIAGAQVRRVRFTGAAEDADARPVEWVGAAR